MSTHKHIDKLCLAAVLLALLITAVLLFLPDSSPSKAAMGYEDKLFDPALVHTIDIAMEDWEGFLETCENEEYAVCDVTIDGEHLPNVAIRAKGNTSLSTVAQSGSSRYSFKIEFDQYDSGNSYHGLDKLSLNNLIQDNTLMKDYLVYQMMGELGTPAPLCSYVQITVNGEPWGLYLAVEAIEESFLQRNYGTDYGELYKPDSMNMGGGRGNGRDFRMENVEIPEAGGKGGMQAFPQNGRSGGFGGEMGASDVKLQYIDDDPDSYANIFDSAKTEITDADQTRLIRALQTLNSAEEPERAVNTEDVIHYFVVHNFVCNGDSYTGSMIHNYYLYEQEGQLSMLPWDYNLAFGGFQSGSASAVVNEDIDAGAELTDRPMLHWIFTDEAWISAYHSAFQAFLDTVDAEAIVDQTYALIAPYAAQDSGKFCTTAEFEAGVAALKQFLALRTESVSRQLAGEDTPVDAEGLNLSDMGTMGMGGGMEPMPQEMDRPEWAEFPQATEPPQAMDFPDRMQRPYPAALPQTPMQADTIPTRWLLPALSLVILTVGFAIALTYRRRR